MNQLVHHDLTPIEDYGLRAVHDVVFTQARKAGACFDCATQIGFACTDRLDGTEKRAGHPRELHLHPRCKSACRREA